MLAPKTKHERTIIAQVRQFTDMFSWERTKGGHIKVIFKNVRKASVIFGKSPSDHRNAKNALADIRRAMSLAGIEQKGV